MPNDTPRKRQTCVTEWLVLATNQIASPPVVKYRCYAMSREREREQKQCAGRPRYYCTLSDQHQLLGHSVVHCWRQFFF